MSLEQLRLEYDRAKRLFEGCGCTVYKKQMTRVDAQIKKLEAQIKPAE